MAAGLQPMLLFLFSCTNPCDIDNFVNTVPFQAHCTAWLTKLNLSLKKNQHCSQGDHVITLSSNPFPPHLSNSVLINFFNEKILNIRKTTHERNIQDLLVSPITKLPVDPATQARHASGLISPDEPSATGFYSIVFSYKTTSSLLDPIPTRLLKEVFPLLVSSLLDIINLSLTSGFVSQTSLLK